MKSIEQLVLKTAFLLCVAMAPAISMAAMKFVPATSCHERGGHGITKDVSGIYASTNGTGIVYCPFQLEKDSTKSVRVWAFLKDWGNTPSSTCTIYQHSLYTGDLKESHYHSFQYAKSGSTYSDNKPYRHGYTYLSNVGARDMVTAVCLVQPGEDLLGFMVSE